jgi:hypothetical protein
MPESRQSDLERPPEVIDEVKANVGTPAKTLAYCKV